MNKDDRSGTGGTQNDISMPVENSRLARIRINTLCIRKAAQPKRVGMRPS